jgi:hypothetical protein
MPPIPPPTASMRHDALIYGNEMYQLFRFAYKDRWIVRCWLGSHYGVAGLPRNWCVL